MGKAPRIESASEATDLIFQWFVNGKCEELESRNKVLLDTENPHDLAQRIQRYARRIEEIIRKRELLETSIDHFYKHDMKYRYDRSPVLMYVATLMLKHFEYAMLIKMYNGDWL